MLMKSAIEIDHFFYRLFLVFYSCHSFLFAKERISFGMGKEIWDYLSFESRDLRFRENLQLIRIRKMKNMSFIRIRIK